MYKVEGIQKPRIIYSDQLFFPMLNFKWNLILNYKSII